MGIAKTLPLLQDEVDVISSFLRRSYSVVGSCGSGTDIANMEDVSEEMIAELTKGPRYNPNFIY